ncbi:MAG: NUDIX hydrolase [Candidatus Saccharimonadales bacterium]
MMFTYCPSCGKKNSVQKLDDTNYECGSCRWHFWNNAKASTCLFLLRSDGYFLAAKRGREPNKGKYEAVGGFIEYNEDPTDAVIRETLEETNLIAKNPLLIAAYPHVYTPNSLPPVSTTDLIFATFEWEGEPQAGDDVEELTWQPLELIQKPSFVPAYPAELLAKLRALIRPGRATG